MPISVFEFLAVTLLLVSVWGMVTVYVKYGWEDIRAYYATETGEAIIAGVRNALIFTLALGALFGVSGCSGKFLNDASVYSGLDYTKKQSPQCLADGPDERTTSNLGLRGNIYESSDGRFRLNAKYTHHSCAFSPDRNAYDAYGFEVEYKLWTRS